MKFQTGLVDRSTLVEDKRSPLFGPCPSFLSLLSMAPSIDKPGMSVQEAAAINAAAVTRNYSVKPRLQYQTVSAVSGEPHQPIQ
jgi:hypothetical protein